MSKLRRSTPVGLLARGHDKNGSAKERYLQRSGLKNRPSEALTNIVEEDQEPENRDFDMDDVYLTECLQVLDKDTKSEVETPEYSEVEEYDFDDFLSIASTTSFTNLVFETNDDITQEALHAPIPRVPVHNPPVIPRAPCDRPGLLPQPEVHHHQTLDSREVSHSTPEAAKSLNSRLTSFTTPLVKSQGVIKTQGVVKTQGEVTPANQLTSPVELNSSQDNVHRITYSDQEEQPIAEEADDMAGQLTKTSALRAAENGDFITLQRLIDKYPDQSNEILLARDPRGNTPLHRAVLCGQLECLKWLVSHVAEGSLSVRNRDDLTPAAGAAKYGHRECLQWLIEQTSAGIELENNHVSLSLLHHAAVSGKEECLRFLLNFMQGKDLPIDIVDHSGITPSHHAAREGHISCIQTLVEFNADVTVKDRDNRTAADYAYLSGHTSCARYLIAVESCWLLSSRVARLHQELRENKEENQDLKRKIEILESRAVIPDRPDALGAHCQGDGSSSVDSLEGDRDSENVFGKIPKTSRSLNNVPDGESHSESPSQNRGTIYIDAEMENSDHFESIKAKAFERLHGNTDSPSSSGVLTPVSLGECDVSEMQKVITKQMVAVTHKLMMNRHARNVDDRGTLGPGSVSRTSSSSSQSISVRHSDSPLSQERISPSLGLDSDKSSTVLRFNDRSQAGTVDRNVPLREKQSNTPQQYRWSYAGEKNIASTEFLHNNSDTRKDIASKRTTSRVHNPIKVTTPLNSAQTGTKQNGTKRINSQVNSKSSSSDSSVLSSQDDDVMSRDKSKKSSVYTKCSSSECSCDEDGYIKYDLTPTHSRSSFSSDCSSERTNDSPRTTIKPPLKSVRVMLENNTVTKQRDSAQPPVAKKNVRVNLENNTFAKERDNTQLPVTTKHEQARIGINTVARQRQNLPSVQPVFRQSLPTLNNHSEMNNIKKNFEHTQPVARQPLTASKNEARLSSVAKQSVRVNFENGLESNLTTLNRRSRDLTYGSSDQNYGSRDRIQESRDHIQNSPDQAHASRDFLHGARDRIHESRDHIQSSRDQLNGSRNQLHGTNYQRHGSRDHLHGVREPMHVTSVNSPGDKSRSVSSSVEYIVPLKGSEETDFVGNKPNEILEELHHRKTDPLNGYSCERLTPPLEASRASNKANIVRLKAHEYNYMNGLTDQKGGKVAAGENGILHDNGDIYSEGDFINQPELSLGLRQSTLAQLGSDYLSPPQFDDGFEVSKAWYED